MQILSFPKIIRKHNLCVLYRLGDLGTFTIFISSYLNEHEHQTLQLALQKIEDCLV